MLYVVWSLIFLGICAAIDLKEQKVSSRLCFVNATVALLFHIVLQDMSWQDILLGMILGAVFYVISVLTNESIGKGDGIVIFTLGSILGMRTSFQIVVWALISCAVFSIGGMIIKRLSLKSRIPFVPFLFVGCVITFVVWGG